MVDLSSYKPNEPDAFYYSSANALNSKRLFGIRFINSNSAARESQSHIIAHGGDLFYTKTHPSGSFDEIPDSFDRNSVQIGMLILLLGYFASTWYVNNEAHKRRYD
eukprot:NODE_27_length_33950_cov_0.349739.p23 type:complete len:106 gc:universal NODE_27_length_33950_cov_0.349739:2547-2230(-)